MVSVVGFVGGSLRKQNRRMQVMKKSNYEIINDELWYRYRLWHRLRNRMWYRLENRLRYRMWDRFVERLFIRLESKVEECK